MDDAIYAEILAKEFNVVTAENAMKFEAIHPTRRQFGLHPVRLTPA